MCELSIASDEIIPEDVARVDKEAKTTRESALEGCDHFLCIFHGSKDLYLAAITASIPNTYLAKHIDALILHLAHQIQELLGSKSWHKNLLQKANMVHQIFSNSISIYAHLRQFSSTYFIL
jgi:hypothetical protein